MSQLENILQNNPWKSCAQDWKADLLNHVERDYILDGDRTIIDSENRMATGNRTQFALQTKLPPQPFIGNPKAKVWLLQYNPGYSGIVDEYDLLGKDCDGRFKRKLVPNRDFKERVDLVVNQYSFRNSEFYALNEKFHTFKTGTRGQGRGIYLWYKSLLFPSKGGLFSHLEVWEQKSFLDDNLFVLEYMPYHSKSFDASCFAFLSSFKFWEELIDYAFESDKILLVNGRNSRGGCYLKSMEGYKKAFSEKRIYEIKRAGNGRSKMRLIKDKTIDYSGPLKTFIEDAKCCSKGFARTEV